MGTHLKRRRTLLAKNREELIASNLNDFALVQYAFVDMARVNIDIPGEILILSLRLASQMDLIENEQRVGWTLTTPE